MATEIKPKTYAEMKNFLYNKAGSLSGKERTEAKKIADEFLFLFADEIKQGKKDGGSIKKLKDGGFPDLSGDGKVTKKDILMGRGVIKKAMGGGVGEAINGLKKRGLKNGGLAGRLAQRGYGKARS
tara:strand:- start:606 stop:983 length:378 start_codon:yes stop_codon:yes gene_type:complete